jgi:lipid-A-disaccharide synthase
MTKRSILLFAGEASGDYHAAAMVRDLKRADPSLAVSGIGGDKLADAGMELLHHYKEINTIGLSEGLGKVRNIMRAYRTMKSELRSGRHDLFLPVDFPDVNLRLCRVARRAGVPVCYYISPQIWAWRKGRIRKIAAYVDRMMTIFPFEEKLYRAAGIGADFVGHTLARDIPPNPDRNALRRELDLDSDHWAVALVPGSRPAEIRRMLPIMCRAAEIHEKAFSGTRFVLPLAGEHLRETVQEIVQSHGVRVNVSLIPAEKVMASSDCGLVTSGTATLQAALAGMPHVVVYRLDRLTWLLAIKVLKPLVMDKDIHVAIANVLSISMQKEGYGPILRMLDAGYRVECSECGRPLFVPELLQDHVTPDALAGWLQRFRSDDKLRTAFREGFGELRSALAPPGGDRTPARVVLECINHG